MLVNLRIALATVIVMVILVHKISKAAFEDALKIIVIDEEVTRTSDLNTTRMYRPQDNRLNAFQEIEFIGEYVLIGEQGNVYIWNMAATDDIDFEFNMTFGLKAQTGSGLGCESLVSDTERVCQNYITIIQPISNGNAIVCGTNQLFPVCYKCTLDNTPSVNLTCDQNNAYFTEDYGIVAHTPLQDTAWLYVNLTGIGEVVFTGANEDKGLDSVFSRTEVTSDGQLDFTTIIKTDGDDPDWLNNAEFVGDPIDYGDHVYFFYRETATEYINAGKIVYSRVARVCKNDAGGGPGTQLDNRWTTFQKARLNCSVQGEFPYFFNELQDIHQSNDETNGEIIFATFSTPEAGATGSAVCVYRLDEIDELFNQAMFKGAQNPSSLWLPIAAGSVPSPRPGSCSTPQPTSSYSFIKDYPLMDSLVPNTRNYRTKQSYSHESNSPLGVLQGVLVTELVVDEQVSDASGVMHDIFFLASDTGIIYKMYVAGENHAVVFEEDDLEFDRSNNETLLTMKLRNNKLIIGTTEGIYTLPVEHCNLTDDSGYCYKCTERQDPYCSWSNNDKCQHLPDVTGAIQCLRKTEDQEPYQCGNDGGACDDWPGPKFVFASDNQTYVVGSSVGVTLFFTVTAPPGSKIQYYLNCDLDDGTSCIDRFESIPTIAVNANPSAVQWISVTYKADTWDGQSGAIVNFTAIINGNRCGITRTLRIDVDDSGFDIEKAWNVKPADIIEYDSIIAGYKYNVTEYQKLVVEQCPVGRTCENTCTP